MTAIDPNRIVEILRELIAVPSPTGYTRDATKYLMYFAKANHIDAIETRKGAVAYQFKGENPQGRHVGFAAHVDTLGAMVKSVTDKSVKIVAMGGLPPHFAIGDYCTIHTFDGTKFSGTILPDNPSVHVSKKWSETQIKFDDLHVRVDYKLKEKEELSALIPVGSYIILDPKFSVVNGFVKTRFLDDKASAAVQLALAELVAKDRSFLAKLASLTIYFNVTEETGQGIAALEPLLDDLVIVDMGAVGDGLQGDEYSVSICVKDSTGPYHYELTQRLITLAKENTLGFKTDIFPFYGSDGSAALAAGRDLRVALIGPGVAASHGYERTHIEGLDNTAKLMQLYLLSL